MVGARKPDSEFVKQMVSHKDNPATHMPTLLTGQETMVTPTEEAAQEFEKHKSESTITAISKNREQRFENRIARPSPC